MEIKKKSQKLKIYSSLYFTSHLLKFLTLPRGENFLSASLVWNLVQSRKERVLDSEPSRRGEPAGEVEQLIIACSRHPHPDHL